MKETNKPIHRLDYGRIHASIWLNSHEEFPDFHSVTVGCRRFKKEEGWQDSHTYGALDLLTLSKIALDCHTWIQEHKSPKTSPLSLPAIPSDINLTDSGDLHEVQTT